MNDAVFLFGQDFVSLALSDPEGGQMLDSDFDAVSAVINAIVVFNGRGIDDAAREYCAGLSYRLKIGLVWALCDDKRKQVYGAID